MLRSLHKKVEGYFGQSVELISLHKERGDKIPLAVKCDLLGMNMPIAKNGDTMTALYNDILKRIDDTLHAEGFLKPEQHLPEFLCYHQNHSCFDHGIVSATLLLSTIINYCGIAERMVKEDSLFLLMWDIEPKSLTKKLREKSMLLLMEAVYTMMVHNLYPSVYRVKVGNELLHSLGKNSFLYFACYVMAYSYWTAFSRSSRQNVCWIFLWKGVVLIY